MTIKRCFCTIAFRDETIQDIIPKIAEIGYDGIEIWGGHIEDKSDEQLLVIRMLAKRHNLSIECLSPYFWFTNSKELHDESLRRAARFVHYCQILECPKIRTFTDAGPTGIGSDVATEEHWQTAVTALQTICDYDPDI
jgi:3-dehydroshikimate dehydratase